MPFPASGDELPLAPQRLLRAHCAAMASMLALLWTRRRAIGDRLPLVVIGLVLSGVTAVLLGYSVTNFGTLWRMRPIVMIPLWVMAVALSPRNELPCESATEPRRWG